MTPAGLISMIRWLLLSGVLIGLPGCATTRLVQVATVADSPATPFARLLVLGPPALEARQDFEEQMVAVLASASNSTAMAGSSLLPTAALITPAVITETATRVGADGVLTVMPVNITVIQHAAPPGLYYPAMRFDVLRLEIRLYALGGRQPVWRALSETIDPTRQLPTELAARVVADLSRRGLLAQFDGEQPGEQPGALPD